MYGLTATPTRKDGHHPIIHMQCGDIRYKDNAKKQAEIRPFDHTMTTRFTPLDPTIHRDMPLQSVYTHLIKNGHRNQMIVEDIVGNHHKNRHALVLTERVEHVRILQELLEHKIENVIAVTGSMGAKKKRETMQQISKVPEDQSFTIISTGKYIGEGFDESRLDTLFLALPISWKGRLQQYAGRLHRLHERKTEVQIIDYADIHVPVLERMYQKRLSGYSSMGYSMKGKGQEEGKRQTIFRTQNYFNHLRKDLIEAKEDILISSPSLSSKQIQEFLNVSEKADAEILVATKDGESIKNATHRGNRQRLVEKLQNSGNSLMLKNDCYHRCVIIDHSIIWYGSIDVLGNNDKDSSFIRIESPVLAKEMEETVK